MCTGDNCTELAGGNRYSGKMLLCFKQTIVLLLSFSGVLVQFSLGSSWKNLLRSQAD